MPYITQARRDPVVTEQPPAKGVNEPLNAGELTFQVAHVTEAYRALKGDSFQTYADIVAALECAKQEFYRRVAAPYETGKESANGDVYAPLA